MRKGVQLVNPDDVQDEENSDELYDKVVVQEFD